MTTVGQPASASPRRIIQVRRCRLIDRSPVRVLVGIFAYGCVMTLILVVVEISVLGRMRGAVAGQQGAASEDGSARSAVHSEAHR